MKYCKSTAAEGIRQAVLGNPNGNPDSLLISLVVMFSLVKFQLGMGDGGWGWAWGWGMGIKDEEEGWRG